MQQYAMSHCILSLGTTVCDFALQFITVHGSLSCCSAILRCSPSHYMTVCHVAVILSSSISVCHSALLCIIGQNIASSCVALHHCTWLSIVVCGALSFLHNCLSVNIQPCHSTLHSITVHDVLSLYLTHSDSSNTVLLYK